MKFYTLVLCAAFLAGCAQKKEDPVEKPVVAVKVANAELADLPRLVSAPATLFPQAQANISARVTAPIRELRARKGDTVRAGQVLAVLENRDILAQQREAQAAVQDSEANLQKLAGGTIPTDVERARGQVETTQAALSQAKKNSERRERLFQQGAIPQRDLLQTQTELATAQTNYDVARKSLDLLQNQSRGPDLAIARSKVEQAKARLAGNDANLQFTELRSPFAGTITEQFLYPGDMAKPDTPIYTVMDLSTVIARAQVPEANAAAVRKGQACSFTGADAEAGIAAAGRITVVNRAVDSARRTVEVWCEIPQPPIALRAGVFGTVRIQTGSIARAVVVPEAAVQFQEGTRNGEVFVVDGKNVAHKRDVEAGETLAGKVQILKGLKAGERVVIEGGYSLPDGAQVQLPGAQPPGDKKP